MTVAAQQAPSTRRWYEARTSRPLGVLILSLLAAVIAPFIGTVFYPGELIWTLVIGGYSSAALAFLTALAWDRHSRLQEEARQTDAERRRNESRLQLEQEARVVEAKRRFGALELELLRLKASIERTKREQHS